MLLVGKLEAPMRKFLILLVPIVLLAFASGALADTVNYTVTGTIGPETFIFTFSEPGTVASPDTFTTANFTDGSIVLTDLPIEVRYFAAGQSGLIDIIATIEG